MALIKCKECGKEMSDTAEVCPHCGFKYQRTKVVNKSNQIRTGSIVSLISCSILLIIIMVLYFTGDSTASNEHKVKENTIATIDIEFTSSETSQFVSYSFLVSIIVPSICLIFDILYLCGVIKNVKFFKIIMLSLAIIQLIASVISINMLLCCGIVYIIFPIINFVGAILIVTGKAEK